MRFIKALFLPITTTLDFTQKYFKSLVFIVILFLIIPNTTDKNSLMKPNLARIDLSGPIIDANKIVEDIEKLKKNDNIKGVLFVVNSPGGAVSPSIEIAMAIKSLVEKKPVIAYATGTMASGSYYASIWANKIIANPGSVIGSIGVIFQSVNMKELVNKIGIKEQTVYAGKYKTVGSVFRDWKEFEKEEIQTLIDDTYNLFVKDVASARGLNINQKTDFADAHIYIAHKAKKVGLIDDIGSMSKAKKELVKLSKVLVPKWKKRNKVDRIIDKIISETTTKISSMFFGLKAVL